MASKIYTQEEVTRLRKQWLILSELVELFKKAHVKGLTFIEKVGFSSRSLTSKLPTNHQLISWEYHPENRQLDLNIAKLDRYESKISVYIGSAKDDWKSDPVEIITNREEVSTVSFILPADVTGNVIAYLAVDDVFNQLNGQLDLLLSKKIFFTKEEVSKLIDQWDILTELIVSTLEAESLGLSFVDTYANHALHYTDPQAYLLSYIRYHNVPLVVITDVSTNVTSKYTHVTVRITEIAELLDAWELHATNSSRTPATWSNKQRIDLGFDQDTTIVFKIPHKDLEPTIFLVGIIDGSSRLSHDVNLPRFKVNYTRSKNHVSVQIERLIPGDEKVFLGLFKENIKIAYEEVETQWNVKTEHRLDIPAGSADLNLTLKLYIIGEILEEIQI